MRQVYKIKNLDTGEFSSGISWDPHWQKSGKTFNSLGLAQKHINGSRNNRSYSIYNRDFSNIEIIEYNIVPSGKTFPVKIASPV